jgi:hypothetical protein
MDNKGVCEGASFGLEDSGHGSRLEGISGKPIDCLRRQSDDSTFPKHLDGG